MFECMIALENQWFMPMSLVCLEQTCLVPSLRLARLLQKKKLSERRVGRSALHRVLSRLFLRVGCSLLYFAAFQSCQWLFFCLSPGDAETFAGVSGNEDVSTGVESDRHSRGRYIVDTRSLVPLAGGPQLDVPEAVHSRGRSMELLEQAFDDGNISAQMRNLLVWFHVGSKILSHFFHFRSIRDWSCCHCHSCHWSSDGVAPFVRRRKHSCCLP